MTFGNETDEEQAFAILDAYADRFRVGVGAQ
jgi:hypothetical protein